MARLNGWVCKQVCLYMYWSSTDSQMAKLEIAAKELFCQMFCQKVRGKKLHLFAVSASSIHIPAVNIRFFELQQFSLRSRLKPSQACLKHECKWLVDCVYATQAVANISSLLFISVSLSVCLRLLSFRMIRCWHLKFPSSFHHSSLQKLHWNLSAFL